MCFFKKSQLVSPHLRVLLAHCLDVLCPLLDAAKLVRVRALGVLLTVLAHVLYLLFLN